LDVGIFGAQKYFKHRVKISKAKYSDETVAIVKLINSLRRATPPNSIVKAFRACGITATCTPSPAGAITKFFVDPSMAKTARREIDQIERCSLEASGKNQRSVHTASLPAVAIPPLLTSEQDEMAKKPPNAKKITLTRLYEVRPKRKAN